MDEFYIGFDLSTQQLKTVVVKSNLEIVFEEAVRFDDVGKYATNGGVHIEGLRVTTPTLLWVEALDILLDKLKSAGVDLSLVKGLSGAGQQHGSVYWKKGASEILKNLISTQPLSQQLADCFAISDSPIWMDSSTTEQCKYLDSAAGGPQSLANITGSRAYERFTGNQILKIIQNNSEAYQNTERISLVSSFLGSLLRGAYCNIDESDGSGMNLMNIYSRKWEPALIDACSSDLALKLGDVVPTCTIQGRISPYFVDRYGFSPSCAVVTCMGDNPASLAGMRLSSNDVAVSLGSSDVVFLWLKEPIPKTEGHIFVNPVLSTDYMALLCFKNGSFTREAINNKYCCGDWFNFESLLHQEPIGNKGNIGFYFTLPEIIPSNVEGCFLFDGNNEPVDDFSASVHVRALIEGQCLSRRIHAEDMGFNIGENTRILATGGASNNQAILQVMSDVFNAPVYTQEIANSAALGAAFLALHTVNSSSDNLSFESRMSKGPQFQIVATPQANSKEIYKAMAERYRRLEKQITKNV